MAESERHVTFDTNAKKHDGMHPMHRLLDDIVHTFFQHQAIRRMGDMRDYLKIRWTPADERVHAECAYLDQLCANLVERANQLGDRDSAPMLQQGGGRGHYMRVAHVPHIRQMCKWIGRVVEERRLAFQFARPHAHTKSHATPPTPHSHEKDPRPDID